MHAFLSLVLEEWVVVWDLDGEALGVGDEGTDGAGPVLHATLDAVLVAVAQSVNQRCINILPNLGEGVFSEKARHPLMYKRYD